MATAAQIEANRRNAQKSTGPKTDGGKARVRRNALKHGMTARTIMPVLPQEDPKELEERTQEWVSDVQPQNAIERKLVDPTAGLSLAIERGERIETAHPRKMRNADFGMGNAEKADGECQTADDEWQMAHDECQVAEGEPNGGGEQKMGDDACDGGDGWLR